MEPGATVESEDAVESQIRPEVAYVGERAVSLVECLLDEIIPKTPANKTTAAVHKLTVCGMIIATQHARGAVSEFAAGRSYSGMALDRCMYEAMVRVMEWNLRPKRAMKSWTGIPVYAAWEEARRAGDDLKSPLGVNSNMPDGVKRDLAKYLAKRRGAEKVNESTFADAARNVWGKHGLNANQLQADIFVHFDTPSLFVHCKPLVAEDVFDTSHDAEWSIRDVSRMAEPNARVLEIARLLILFARFVAPRFGYGVEAVDLVLADWSKAVERHEETLLGVVPTPEVGARPQSADGGQS